MAWQEAQALAQLSPVFAPGVQPPSVGIAIQAWNLMGGEIAWPALEYVVERFGVEDVESFVEQLATIRDSQQQKES